MPLKLTAKQMEKFVKILTEGASADMAYAVIDDVMEETAAEFPDVKRLKAAKKELTRQLKAIDKAIAILAPVKKE